MCIPEALMTPRHTLAIAIVAVSVALVASMSVVAQNRYALKARNGLAFADIKGYDTWSDVAPSQTMTASRASSRTAS
jgi:hypothetical protein